MCTIFCIVCEPYEDVIEVWHTNWLLYRHSIFFAANVALNFDASSVSLHAAVCREIVDRCLTKLSHKQVGYISKFEANG